MKKTGTDLSIIILSFNTAALLRECLRSIYASSFGEYKVEIIVCDNGSKDESLAMVRKEFPKVIIIDNGGNIGFAAGNNTGIKIANGEYILLLNSDTEVNHNTLEFMLDYMNENPRVGAATCKLLLSDGTLDPACHRGFPTPWAALTYFCKLEKLFPQSQILAQYHQTYKPMRAVHEVDMISGAFFLVRRKVIKQVGLLDEDYFFYGEDMDWCFRIKESGWKIMFNPGAAILHRKKASGRANADRERRVRTELFFYKYNKLFYQKNYDHLYPQAIMFLIYLLFNVRIFLLKNFKI